jgi:hypothetical protein
VNPALNLHQELETAVRDAAGAWQFVRRFAETFATALVAADGCDDLVGKRNDLTRSQDRLLVPDQVHVDDTGQVLVFRVENQHVVQWGIPLSMVTEPDPPVVFRLDSASQAERAWRPFLERVSLACVEMVLSEWLSSGEEFADNRELDDEAIVLLENQFRRLPMSDYPFWAEPGGGPMRWFERRGAILRENPGTWLWVRAASAEGIAAVRNALPGEWVMDEG